MVNGLSAMYERERARIAALCDGRGDYAHPVFGEGPEKPTVMLIGEAPGAEEAKLSRPFVGKAGKQLDELLQRADIDRSRVYVTNAVKYRPVNVKARSVTNRTPNAAEVGAGLALLTEEIRSLAPQVIVTLGNTPLNAVLSIAGGERKTIGEAHGKCITIELCGQKLMLVPQYHPASVIYNRALAPVLENDLIALGGYIKAMEAKK